MTAPLFAQSQEVPSVVGSAPAAQYAAALPAETQASKAARAAEHGAAIRARDMSERHEAVGQPKKTESQEWIESLGIPEWAFD